MALEVEHLKHVANVPKLEQQTEEFILEGKLLHAHRNLADLETSRDQLLLELHKQESVNEKDANVSSSHCASGFLVGRKCSVHEYTRMPIAHASSRSVPYFKQGLEDPTKEKCLRVKLKDFYLLGVKGYGSTQKDVM